ncbi:TPA: hypothetical protein DD449_03345 [Candidatus Berkelbacteria bacterium]|uniref:Uncharacterized protein n=1 Tax=Berkelbacteria bacterium GW2011_GWE1_39_12 TaxID=1618337 RepID=A0A0G4B536_9BACT|nr:MAG: hypothetical protein UT28_C0001G0298 [Berkelbacteria bacterium GW2011_GWE1_39_12]HBO60692.1 hypothetical protein [Candidatus Berkelbacteria bacterium]
MKDGIYSREKSGFWIQPISHGDKSQDPRQGQMISDERSRRSASAITQVNAAFSTNYTSSSELYAADVADHVRKYDGLVGLRLSK